MKPKLQIILMNFFLSQSYRNNNGRPMAVALLSLLPALLSAQSITNIDMTSTVIQQGAQRLGMNIGNHDFYDSGQLTKNLIFRNPGFEPQLYQSLIRCASGTATSCVDDDGYSAWPASFWSGASYEVMHGTAIGRKGTIAASTVAANGNGAVLTFDKSGTVPAQGDYLIVRKQIPGNPTGGWWPGLQGSATFAAETVDLPPGTSGVQALRMTAPTSADSATVASYFDGSQGQTFLQLNGHFQFTFKAKGVGGNNTIQVTVYRSGGAGYLSQTVNLTNAWTTYNLPFTASETGTSIGSMNVYLAANGPTSVLLDDVSLTQTDGLAANPTQYRDSVVTALKAYSPGTIRYWDGQLGESLDNWIAPAFGRKPAGFSAWTSNVQDISVGLHEFLELCQTTGADPWVVMPLVFSPAEASNLVEYLSGPANSTYGAKRAARGQSAPWTSVFGKIHVEFGNEAWNSDFRGGDMEYSDAYGIYSNAVFGAMRANPNFVKSSYDLIVGGQEGYLGRNQAIVSNATQQDTLTLAGYLSPSVDNYATNEQLFGPLFAEPEEDTSLAGVFGQNRSLSTNVATYELNLTTVGGSIDQVTLNRYAPSLGAGLAVADHMLLMMRDLGVHPINIWQLGQYNLGRSDGKTVPLFGAVIDMGVTNRRRPQFLAAALANTAIGGNMIQAIQGGPGPNANPTWKQPLENGVQFGAAHYIQSYAFANGNSRSVIVFNLHRSNSLQVTFSDVNAPSGAVQVQRLTSSNVTDTNENAQNVNVTSQQLTGFNPANPYTLPPYSMTVMTWTALAVQPVTVSVSPGATTLGPGGNQQMTAAVANAANQGVKWSMTPASGTLSSSGMYSAPSNFTTAQSVTVTATSVADPTKNGTAMIALAPPVAVSVFPNNATLGTLQTKQFTVSVQNTSNTAVNWSIAPAIGTISNAGLYTAPSLISSAATVTVTAYSVASPMQSATATITLTPSGSGPFTPIAINAGGTAYTDANGLFWAADTGFIGGNVSAVTSNIANTTSQALYQTQRWASFSYPFTVPNGTYQLTLKFAESFWINPGQRVFNVLVNGQTELPNFDIIAAAGSRFTAVDRVIITTVTNGQLTLSFSSVVDFPAVNAIELVQVTPIAVSPPAASLTAGQSRQFSATGGTSSSYVWTVSPQIGTISSTGLYTAPSSLSAPQTVSLSVSSVGATSNAAVATVNLTPSVAQTAAFAINAGGASYTDPTGQIWAADTGFTGGAIEVETGAVTRTTTPALYQTNHWGMSSFTAKVPNGNYTVVLKFAELFWNGAGQRVFNVTANGTAVLTNFDILAAVGGRYRAIDKSFNVSVTNGQINLQFEKVVDNPLVSAIEVIPH